MLSWKLSHQNPMDAIRKAMENMRISTTLLLLIALVAIKTTTIAAAAAATAAATAFPQHDLTVMEDSSADPPPSGVCGLVNCMQGACKSSITPPGFDCECYPGWKKLFGLCVVPDCSFNMDCGNQSLPSPSPAPSGFPPPLFTPCFLVWCGEGQCVANGTNHTCQCNSGSANLLNMSGMPCIKQCNLGADCNGVQIGPPIQPPPPSLPASSSAAPGSGKGNGSALPPNSSRNYKAVSVVLVAAAITLIWT